jgi:D-aminopeptidase
VKIFISFDMEGVAGIVDWSQCIAPGQAYEEGRALLLGEVNAAIDGALAGGATEIVCNDSHGTMNNLNPADLHGRAAYIAGRHKPLYMMQGMDDTVDAAQSHPLDAREKIAAAAEAAVRAGAAIPAPDVTLPARLDVHVQTADMAEVASWVKGVERTGTRTVRIEGEDPLAVYRSFVGITYITRVAEGR